MESEFKRRKINPPRRIISPVKETLANANDSPMAAGTQLSTEEAKNSAIAQAQQEGCTANFRICDSQFGNFLIPAIPTRDELSE